MVERALIKSVLVSSNGGTAFGGNPETIYIKTGQADITGKTTFQAPLDSTLQEIIDAAIAAVIAAQPAGFNLTLDDVIWSTQVGQ